MRELIFWGATGQARVLREALDDTRERVVAVVDNREVASPFDGVPLLHGERDLDDWLAARGEADGLGFCVAVGGAHGRDRLALAELLSARGLAPHTIVHRRAFVARDAVLGPGCQVLAQAAVCAQARLGRGVIVNTAASVDHDCRIGDGVHLAPGARLAGEIEVGARAFVGIGAAILPGLRIGADAVVGAGAVVTRNVAAGTTVVGVPARQR